MSVLKSLCTLAIAIYAVSVKVEAVPQALERVRLIVLTDIENEPDDRESMVRLLVYSNQIDLRGIVATTSTHMRDRIWPETIHKMVAAYGRVRPNLLKHEKGYPTEKYLHGIVFSGQPAYGMAAVGADKGTAGSRCIIDELKSSDRPLWVSVWGGANTLAQALLTLRAECGDKAQLDDYLSRLRVYAISDQDDSGAWIRREFPQVAYIVSPGGYGNATWRGMNCTIDGCDAENALVSSLWIEQNVQQGHGALGALYPDVAYGMEGDTPAWLGLLSNGLNVPEHPEYGGWGGRYTLYTPRLEDCDPWGYTGNVPVERETRPIWTNAIDSYRPFVLCANGGRMRRGDRTFDGAQVTVWRWRKAVQHDFAARMDWCTQPYGKANHAPVAVLSHPDRLTVKGGATFTLEAQQSYDPDGDNLSFLWYNYREAGSHDSEVLPWGEHCIAHVNVNAPKVDKTTELHFILEVTDKGTPALTSYRRVIVTVEP